MAKRWYFRSWIARFILFRRSFPSLINHKKIFISFFFFLSFLVPRIRGWSNQPQTTLSFWWHRVARQFMEKPENNLQLVDIICSEFMYSVTGPCAENKTKDSQRVRDETEKHALSQTSANCIGHVIMPNGEITQKTRLIIFFLIDQV